MKKSGSARRFRINALGFSSLYIFTSTIGGYVLFSWLLGVSYLLHSISEGLTKDSLFLGLIYLVGIPVLIYVLHVVLPKIKSVTFFACITFLLTICAEYYAHTSFFTQDHHLNNPVFYLVVFLYIGIKTFLLTYIWKLLVRDHITSDLPLKTYLVSALVLVVLFIPIYSAIAEGTYVRLGGYLFDKYLVNIFFLDQGGYMLITLSLYVLIFVAIVGKILNVLGYGTNK